MLPESSTVLVVEEVQRPRGREQSQAASSKPFEHRGRSGAHVKEDSGQRQVAKAELGDSILIKDSLSRG